MSRLGKKRTVLLIIFMIIALPLVWILSVVKIYTLGIVSVIEIYTLWTFRKEKWHLIREGMSEEEVRSILGNPYKIFKAGEVAKLYDYTFKPRIVSGKCFVYMSKEDPTFVLYIYFDKEGKVEDKFIGGT